MTPRSFFLGRQYVITCPCHDGGNNFELKKQSLNVLENKGPVWKAFGRCSYVYENKHTYTNIAGMSLKIKVVSGVATLSLLPEPQVSFSDV